MARSLSPRHAAEKLGITTDTLRRWEREGLLQSERTPGGQRRYQEEIVAALLNDNAPATHRNNFAHRRVSADDANDDDSLSLRPRIEDASPWDQRVKEQRADLEMTKLRCERAALIRAEREERDTRQREAEERQREGKKRAEEAQRRAQADAEELRRLDVLRSYGRSLAMIAPADFQAKVVRNLLRTVNGEAFPPDLADRYARELVSARVEGILKPWRDAQAKERAKVDDTRKCESLVTSGIWYSTTETGDWDRNAAGRARRKVEGALRDEVEADWTQDDVRDLVDEVLNEWDDD